MSKRRVPLGLRSSVVRKPLSKEKEEKEVNKPEIEKVDIVPIKEQATKTTEPKKGKGRPSTKKGKKLVKYSMDIHPELKRAVVKAAAIYDKDVHVMWNEIIFDWFAKESKKHPDWYKSIKVEKNEL